MEGSFNSDRERNRFAEEQHRRMYEEIREQVYRDAYRDGYKDGESEGYSLGYQHATHDHRHNLHAKRLRDMHWHGKPSKSWSWI